MAHRYEVQLSQYDTGPPELAQHLYDFQRFFESYGNLHESRVELTPQPTWKAHLCTNHNLDVVKGDAKKTFGGFELKITSATTGECHDCRNAA